jgi:hypothetical protein
MLVRKIASFEFEIGALISHQDVSFYPDTLGLCLGFKG